MLELEYHWFGESIQALCQTISDMAMVLGRIEYGLTVEDSSLLTVLVADGTCSSK